MEQLLAALKAARIEWYRAFFLTDIQGMMDQSDRIGEFEYRIACITGEMA